MGSKNKLKKFNENLNFKNLFQPNRDDILNSNFKFKGRWNDYFENSNPITLELGCGKGEYSFELAKKYHNRNFIGIDIKGARIWTGAKKSTNLKMKNICFIRTNIDLIGNLFSDSEIDEIWITFPDPQIKIQRKKHRLINEFYLGLYKRILKKDGVIHLKTDSEFLHGYTLGLIESNEIELIHSNHDIYSNDNAPIDALKIQTFYENQYLKENKKITYLSFKFIYE